MSKQKVKQTLKCIINRFKNGDIPEAVSFSMFPVIKVPAAKWSKLNRTIMFLAGTHDARGFKQWQQAGRKVKKGSKALYILAPNFRKIENQETGDEESILIAERVEQLPEAEIFRLPATSMQVCGLLIPTLVTTIVVLFTILLTSTPVTIYLVFAILLATAVCTFFVPGERSEESKCLRVTQMEASPYSRPRSWRWGVYG